MKNFLADILYGKEWHNKLLYYTADSLLLLILIITLTTCADFDKPFMVMERIPGGTFMMGHTDGTWSADETPQHKVILSGFYIGKYEVTQGQYKAVMDDDPSDTKGTDLPVESVSWDKAVEFCNKLSEMEGLKPVYTIPDYTADWSADGYRLPTEAEWEYACKAGTTTKYNTGIDITIDQANFDGSLGRTNPVGSYKPNRWGLYDMHGNVYEWCWDLFGGYDGGVQVDPRGAEFGAERVIRGGSFLSIDDELYSFRRFNDAMSLPPREIGFRVVRR